jgi:hypothetical protein
MVSCNLKNMAAVVLDMEAKHKEYFFSNHLNKTLVNIHQIAYIHIIEDNHNEVSLESFKWKRFREDK